MKDEHVLIKLEHNALVLEMWGGKNDDLASQIINGHYVIESDCCKASFIKLGLKQSP